MAATLDALPILLLILIGLTIRVGGLVDQHSGLVLTRLAYYVTIPSAIYSSIARSQLTSGMLLLPAIGFVLPCLLAGAMWLMTRRLAERPERRGVPLVAMVVLGVFGYPFFELFFGPAGLARMAMYDVGNSLYAGTVALLLARRLGRGSEGENGLPWRAVVGSPVLLAAVLGVLASLLEVVLPAPLEDLLGRLASANTPLAMISVGVYVWPRRGHLLLVAQWLLTRMVLGAFLGWGLALLLGLNGLEVVVAGAAPALPAGTTALIYATNEGLDAELAASLIAISVIVGMVTVSTLPRLLASIYL